MKRNWELRKEEDKFQQDPLFQFKIHKKKRMMIVSNNININIQMKIVSRNHWTKCMFACMRWDINQWKKMFPILSSKIKWNPFKWIKEWTGFIWNWDWWINDMHIICTGFQFISSILSFQFNVTIRFFGLLPPLSQ